MNATLLSNIVALLSSVVPPIVEKFTAPHKEELEALRKEVEALKAQKAAK